MSRAGPDEPEPLLAEQLAYYRALGLDYEDPAIWALGGSEVAEALDSFRPTGDVLELACGTGLWTRQLLRHATSVTAVDAAPEMLAAPPPPGAGGGGGEGGGGGGERGLPPRSAVGDGRASPPEPGFAGREAHKR